MHTGQPAVALADRRPHGLDDNGFSHDTSPLNVVFPEGRATKFTRSTYWLVGCDLMFLPI